MSEETIAAEAAPREVLSEQPEGLRSISTRSDDEIISDAFDKVAAVPDDEAEPEDEPEKAKPEKPKAEKPEDKPKAERQPDGKFKPKAEAEEIPADKFAPRKTAHPEAPSRFDDAAKGEWDAVGENTRGAIHRMQRELETGIQKYRGAAEEYETVREYADMARESGTDLKSALSRYVAMEQELRRDPIAGLKAVVANLGLKGANGQPATLHDIAAFVMNQRPDQAASLREAESAGLRQELAEMKRQMAGVSQHVQAQREDARTQSIASEWSAFQSRNPQAGAYEGEMAEFLTKYPASGNITITDRLSDALAWAQSRYPDKTAAHTRVVEAAHTREMPERPVNPAGRKSISGVPGGSVSQTRNLSTDDIISRALDAHGL